MSKYQVDLAASGKIRLWYNDLASVEIPSTLIGLDVLREILQHAQLGRTRMGETGAPTQAQIDHYVKTWKLDNPDIVDQVDWEGMDL